MKISIIKKYLVLSLLLVGCLMLISCQNNIQAPITEEKNNSSNKETELSEDNENVDKQILGQVDKLTEDKNEILVVNNEQIKSENKIIGIINDIFIKDNKTYITVDEVEFFRGEAAYNEARKDSKLYKDENGNEFLPNGYYLRNISSELKTYEVSKDAIFKLCIYIVDPSSTTNSAETVDVKYSEFVKYINSTKGFDGRSRMCWISSENNLVNKIDMQYTP